MLWIDVWVYVCVSIFMYIHDPIYTHVHKYIVYIIQIYTYYVSYKYTHTQICIEFLYIYHFVCVYLRVCLWLVKHIKDGKDLWTRLGSWNIGKCTIRVYWKWIHSYRGNMSSVFFNLLKESLVPFFRLSKDNWTNHIVNCEKPNFRDL